MTAARWHISPKNNFRSSSESNLRRLAFSLGLTFSPKQAACEESDLSLKKQYLHPSKSVFFPSKHLPTKHMGQQNHISLFLWRANLLSGHALMQDIIYICQFGVQQNCSEQKLGQDVGEYCEFSRGIILSSLLSFVPLDSQDVDLGTFTDAMLCLLSHTHRSSTLDLN